MGKCNVGNERKDRRRTASWIGEKTECNYYKCKTCGFVYQVPAYWSDYSAEATMEMPHVNLETKEMCEHIELDLIKE